MSMDYIINHLKYHQGGLQKSKSNNDKTVEIVG